MTVFGRVLIAWTPGLCCMRACARVDYARWISSQSKTRSLLASILAHHQLFLCVLRSLAVWVSGCLEGGAGREKRSTYCRREERAHTINTKRHVYNNFTIRASTAQFPSQPANSKLLTKTPTPARPSVGSVGLVNERTQLDKATRDFDRECPECNLTNSSRTA
ncbi:hypothetical protein BD289DRAFT_294228 [Coniella lustricola]|uniref:Uncharacterized protein n=1 Tax=Coniella lustricola TaxID=2025994 RepID=A0A2T3A4W3_9PEZI|nr:hypothetical protein BD289DRAFT_294228 [Coniella lustricola]